MRYRALDADGDFTFGRSEANFLINSPAAVAQSVLTRLRLWQGEWFLDTTEGTPWSQQILGRNTQAIYDLAIRTRVLDTDGVTSIADYSSSLDAAARKLTVTMKINTAFGETSLTATLTPSGSVQ